MGPAAPFIPIISSVISAGVSLLGAQKEEDLGDRNARRIEEETQEAAARLADQQEANLGAATARSGASGLKTGVGTNQLFIDTLKSKQDRELAFLKRSGASRAEIERKTADARALTGRGKAFGSLMQAAGGIAKL